MSICTLYITRKYPSYYLMQITYITKQIKEIVTSTSEFILKESLVGPLMVFPWLRHLPFIASKFKASKQHPLKMRRLQVCYKFQDVMSSTFLLKI